jgi:hypothetical protein
MGVALMLDWCKGGHRVCYGQIGYYTDYKCPKCGADYYEEIHDHKRPPEGMSLAVCKNLEKLFGTAE